MLKVFESSALRSDTIPDRAPSAVAPAAPAAGLIALEDVPPVAWTALAARALEPNGYYLPDWARAISASAKGLTALSALSAWRTPVQRGADRTLIALMPAVSAWRAWRLPLPVLVSAEAIGLLGTPLIDAAAADEAVGLLLAQGRAAGAHALVLRDCPLDGAVARSVARVLAWSKLRARAVNVHERSVLNIAGDGETLLREAIAPKKLKELRRQRNRLAEQGEVRFAVARTPHQLSAALETFLKLEASGWKGRRGTAFAASEGDARALRRACTALVCQGQCEIATLTVGDRAIVAGIVLRHRDRAFFFKIGVDETFARFSPGVQFTLELTRHLCAEGGLTLADSTAAPGHPMIDHIWRGRMRMGDLIIPLHRRDPLMALIHLTLAARHIARNHARLLVRLFRRRATRTT